MGKAILAHFTDEEIEAYLGVTELYAYTPNTITKKDDLLRQIEEIRKVGYSLNREEHVLARASIGAPIFGVSEKVVAATCIVGEPNRVLRSRNAKLVRLITTMAMEVSRAMGYYPIRQGR